MSNTDRGAEFARAVTLGAQAVADEVYRRAANDPDLPDESFIMISRAMRGKDPLTGDDPQPQPERYFVDVDGNEEPTLWRGAPDDPKPHAVARQSRVGGEVWRLLRRGAGLNDDYITLAREDLSELAETVRVAAVDIEDEPWQAQQSLRGVRARLGEWAGEGR